MDMTYLRNVLSLLLVIAASSCTQAPERVSQPNILFVMMDDLGYGQFGIYNDTLKTSDFDPLFVQLVDSMQGYSHEEALAFSKQAIPTMTKLAESGLMFTKAYTSSNLCSPSRLGVATGTLQNRFGVYENADGEAHGILPGTHLAEHLKEAGYKTAHIGKWHIGRRNRQILADILKSHSLPENTPLMDLLPEHPEVYKEANESGYYGSVIDEHHPLKNGFDYYYGYNTWASQYYNSTLVWEDFEHAGKQKGYNTDVFTDRALDFMEEQVQQDEPFYVQVHYHAVHDSVEPKAPDAYLNRFPSASFDLSNFYAHVHGVDHNVKRMVDFLKSIDQYENTIIVFTSDNGAMAGARHDGHKVGSPLPGNAPFSGTKGSFYQGGIRVPLFIHWPEGIQTASVSDQLVSTLDILPTLIDVGNGEVPNDIDGKSLLPIIENRDATAIHDHLLWAGMHSTAWGFLIEKSFKDHHTERPFAPSSWVVIQDAYLLRFIGNISPGVYFDYPNGKKPVFELFDIHKDPAELHDLAEALPEKVSQLSTLFYTEFANWPPPVSWEREKWEEIVQAEKQQE